MGRNIVLAGLMALATALGASPSISAKANSAPTHENVALVGEMEEPGQVAGPYYSHAAACRKAAYLQKCGYCTSIKYSSAKCCYYVYYH